LAIEGTYVNLYRNDLCLTDDAARISIDTVAGWLMNQAYWAVGRSRADVDKSIEHSHLYGVVDADGRTVACARVVTDEAVFAWICDVFVDERFRGAGIATWMVREVVDTWADAGVVRFLIATRDAHEVYARVGFTPVANPDRYMELDRRSTSESRDDGA
jgi:GNAT superfamily N-acetyltransferase